MKNSKLMFVFSLMTLSTVLLTACGETSGSSLSGSSETTIGSSSVSSEAGMWASAYQLTAEYTELSSWGFEYYFLLNLKSDKTAVLSNYNPATYDDSAWQTNPSFTEEFMTGTWLTGKDREGQDAMLVKLGMGTDAKTTYYAYQGNDGTLTLADVTFPLSPGSTFTRTVTLIGSSEITYDFDGWIAHNKREFVTPTHVVAFTDEENHGTAYFQEDGTVLIYSGYSNVKSGSFRYTNTEFVVTLAETDHAVTVDGKSASFDYTHELGAGYVTEFHFVCADISSLEKTSETSSETSSEIGSEVGSELTEVAVILTWKSTDPSHALVMYDDGTYKYTLSSSGNVVNEVGTFN